MIKVSFQQGSYEVSMWWHIGIANYERIMANILKTSVNRLIDVEYTFV